MRISCSLSCFLVVHSLGRDDSSNGGVGGPNTHPAAKQRTIELLAHRRISTLSSVWGSFLYVL